MKTYSRILLILLCIGNKPLYAQESISLKEAIEQAIASSAQLEAASYEELSADEELRAVRGLRSPQLSLTGGYLLLDRNVALRFNDQKENIAAHLSQFTGQLPEVVQPLVGEITAPLFRADWSLTLQKRQMALLGAEVTLPIWMGGKIGAAIRATQCQKEQTRARSQQIRNQLITQTIERYYGVRLATEAVLLRQQVLAGLESHLQDARQLEANGMIAQAELLYIAYKVADAQRDLQQAELELSTARSALRSTLGGEHEFPADPLFLLDSLPPLSHFQQMAEEKNPLLQEIAYKQQESHEGVVNARSNLFPEVVAMGSATLCHYQVSDLVPRWAVGIGIRWRLFDGLRSERSYRASRYVVERVTHLREEAHKEIDLLVEKCYNDLQSLYEEVVAYEPSIRFATSWLASRRAAFREGVGSASQLIDAELELSATRLERLNAAYRYCLALGRLMEAVGESDQFVTQLHQTAITHIE